MSGDELFDLASSVKSRGDFINFVECLNKDFARDSDEWENNDLTGFLAGLSAFSRDMEGYYRNTGEVVNVDVISWKMAAQMLLAASVYGN